MSQTEKQELMVKYQIGDSEIKLTPSIVQNYIVGSDAKITLQEFKLFTELCRVRKLNPFLKEAYCIKYGNQPATIVVGKDLIVNRAIQNPQYDGKESGVIVLDDDKNIIERQGCFVAPNEVLVGGWCKVYRKDHQYPEYMSVSINECSKKKSNGSLNSNWTSQPATMIEKVAKVRALREAFCDDLGGMYDESEMNVSQSSETIQDVSSYEDNTEKVSLNDL